MFLFKLPPIWNLMNTRKRKEMEEMDRLSELPEPIIHHIFSFLSSKEAINTSVLSKKFRSACLSLPIMRLDLTLPIDSQRKITSGVLHGFHEFLRRHSLDVTLEEFRLHILLYCENFNPRICLFDGHRIDSAINFAVEKSVKELVLKINFNHRPNDSDFAYRIIHAYYRLPLSVLSAQSLAVLILNGFKIELQNLVLNLRNLEKLEMVNCAGIKTLIVSCGKLKIVKIDSCTGLERIEILVPNLESLKINGFERIGKIGERLKQLKLVKKCFSGCEFVKCLSLADVEMTETDFMWEISKLVKLESLELFNCESLESLVLGNPNLQRLKVDCCRDLAKVDISSPNLRSLKFYSDYFMICDINIAACKFLKDIELRQIEISDQWLERNISDKMLGCLEDVKLSECNKLENFTICHSRLKRIEIDNCPMLKVADIAVRRLDSVKLSDKQNVGTHLIVHSLQAHVSVTLFLDPRFGFNMNLKELRERLSFLGHCKELKLICISEKVLIFPEDSREKLVSPLYELQRLKVELKEPIKQLWDLVDNLVWFAPRIISLSIISNFSKEKCLKFGYLEGLDSSEDVFCCRSKLGKCWRHDLKEVIMENFEPTEVMMLKQFMRQKAMRLEKIVTLPDVSNAKTKSSSENNHQN